MRFARGGRASVVINIAPLVDVVFLLVIFFAVSTTFLESAGLELTLPSSSSTSDRSAEELTIVLTRSGTLFLDGDPLEEEALTTQLRAALEGREKKLVVLRADTDASHGDVVRIMDIARLAGATALTVAARQGE